MNRAKALGKSAAVLLFWLAVWQILAMATDSALLLPQPAAVLRRMGELALSGRFWLITSVSLLRILCGAVLAVALGTVLAALCCRFRLLDRLFAPLLTAIRSTPVASFIILLLIWVGRDAVSTVIVLLMVLPVVWGNVCAGIRSVDPLLLRTATVFHFPPVRTLRRVYLPACLPHFLSACRTSLGLAWKAGIAAEVLTVPTISIGRMLYDAKLYLETTDLFAWTAVVILCSLLIEKGLMAAFMRLSRRCQPGGGAAR